MRQARNLGPIWRTQPRHEQGRIPETIHAQMSDGAEAARLPNNQQNICRGKARARQCCYRVGALCAVPDCICCVHTFFSWFLRSARWSGTSHRALSLALWIARADVPTVISSRKAMTVIWRMALRGGNCCTFTVCHRDTPWRCTRRSQITDMKNKKFNADCPMLNASMTDFRIPSPLHTKHNARRREMHVRLRVNKFKCVFGERVHMCVRQSREAGGRASESEADE